MGRLFDGLPVPPGQQDPEAERAEPPPADPVCQGTLLSRAQYLVDIGQWGYRDARLAADVRMTAKDIERWTLGIAEDGPR